MGKRQSFGDRVMSLLYWFLAVVFALPLILVAVAVIGGESPVVFAPVGLICFTLAFFAMRRARKLSGATSPVTAGSARSVRKVVSTKNEFPSSVVGVSFDNDDGTSRQDNIKRYCSAGEQLQLVREPDNVRDSNAIAVLCKGRKIGHLRTELGERYADEIDNEEIEMTASVLEVTGGSSDKQTLGVNILVKLKELN